jgi:hypothetical protein
MSLFSRLKQLAVFGLLMAIAWPGLAQGETSVIEFSGEAHRGKNFVYEVKDHLHFILKPNPLGWEIVLQDPNRPKENLARLTPPYHFVPNPRYLEGWHFRNADNTGPNAIGEKNINAPQHQRRFIFSTKVGQTIDYPPTPAQAGQVARDGTGLLEILDMKLGNFRAGEKAWFEWIRFKVRLQLGEGFHP